MGSGQIEWVLPDEAERMILDAVSRKKGMFAEFPEVCKDDLIAVATHGVRRAHHRYDPSAGAYSTFIESVAQRRLIDLWRHLRRRAEREQQIRRDLPVATEGDVLDAILAELDEELSTGEWLAALCRSLRRNAAKLPPDPPTRPGTFRPRYTWPQKIAVVMLQRKIGVNTRKLAYLLSQHPSWMREIGLAGVPDQMTIFRMAGEVQNYCSTVKIRLLGRGREAA
jgi:hypothetical protein